MPFNKKTFIVLSSIILYILLFISGCAINQARVNRPDLVNRNKKMFIYGHTDQASIYSTVKKKLNELGFEVVENKDEAGATVDYNYECGWDVIHYTCRTFNLFVTDTMSNEIVFQSKFWADSPLSASSLISRMFDKLKKELDQAMAQPVNPPDPRSSGR